MTPEPGHTSTGRYGSRLDPFGGLNVCGDGWLNDPGE
jgi:hypothetical protein